MSRPRGRTLATLLLIFSTAGPAWAQTMLSADQAVAEALAQNAGLRAAESGVAQADAGVADARASWFPRLVVAEAWQRGNQPVFAFSSLLSARRFSADNFAIDALNRPDAVGLFRTSLGVEHLAFDFGGRRAAAHAARGRHDEARLSRDETRATLVVATVDTFGRILAAEAGGRAANAALGSARADRARVADRRDAGLATDADVLALDAYVATLDQRRIQMEGEASVLRAALNRLTGAPLDRAFTLVEPPLPANVAVADLAALLAEAEANRPDLKIARVRSETARATERGVRAARLPAIGIQAGVDFNGTTFGDRSASWVVGAETRWSLSLGGAERARARAASADTARTAALADDTRAAVHLDVVTAFERLRSARARLEAGRAAVAQARESERIVRDRVEAGLGTITDLLRASTAVLDATTAEVSARVDALVSDAQLTRALGRQP